MQNLVPAWNPSYPVLLFKNRQLTLLGFQWGTHEKLRWTTANCTQETLKMVMQIDGTYTIEMKICLWCRKKTQQCLDLLFSASYMSTLHLPLPEALQQVLWYKPLYCRFPNRSTEEPTKFLSVCPGKKSK